MDEQILKKIEEQDRKLDEIYRSVEKMRKYFLIVLIVTIVMIIFPLIGLIFAIPSFLDVYSGLI